MPLTKIKSLGITDGTIVNDDISASAGIVASKLSGVGGLTEVDLFRVTANANFNNLTSGFVTSNWERADSYGFDKIGTGMTESSGVFTFPSNGIYHIAWHSTGEVSGGISSRSINVVIHYTSNNSTYNEVARGHCNDLVFTGNSSAYYAGTNFITKITDTSNQKIKFNLAEQDGDNCLMYGDTNMNLTYAYFYKLN